MDNNVFLKITNLEILSKVSSDLHLFLSQHFFVFRQFLHDCVNDMVGKKGGAFDNYSGDVEWTKEEYETARSFVQNSYRGNLKSGQETFQDANFVNLPTNMNEEIRNCYEIRKNEMLQFVMREGLLKSELPIVENIDWKVKWINGSSKLASISEPVLQVDLHCSDKEAANLKSLVNFEIGAEKLDKFINELESVKTELH